MAVKKITIASLLLALSMIIGIIENLIPPVVPMLPYIKIGFSNIVIILAIVILNYKYSLLIASIKSVLVPLFVGNPIMILYSLPSALLATVLSTIVILSKKISIPVTSMLSAILHNIIQLSVAALMTNYLVFGYLPYFIIIGCISGLITGVISFVLIKYLPKKAIL